MMSCFDQDKFSHMFLTGAAIDFRKEYMTKSKKKKKKKKERQNFTERSQNYFRNCQNQNMPTYGTCKG